MKKLIDAYEAELTMRIREYEITVDQTINLLKDALGQPASTHLGHNLANRATDLSVIAAKVEAAQIALATIRGMAKES